VGSFRLVLAAGVGVVGLAATGAAAASTIAYTSLGPSSSRVWVMRGDGSEKDRLTSGSVVDSAPSLAPGGRRLVFVRRRSGGRDDLFRASVAGSSVRRLTRSRLAEATPTWSPAGDLIGFSAGRAPGSS
jgi:Tol biopolymer transport system component